MSFAKANAQPVVLRLEFSIADAVKQRGIFAVLVAAVRAWAEIKQGHPDVPDHLRADLGLDPIDQSRRFPGMDLHAYRFHPPNRSQF